VPSKQGLGFSRSRAGLDAAVEEYRQIEAEVNAAIKAGQITKEDGEKRKIEARKLIRDK